jgi:hypothetical protein
MEATIFVKQRRQDHNQQRPQIVHQIGLDSGRCAKCQEQKKVIAKQTVNAKCQSFSGHDGQAPLKTRPWQSHQTANQKRAACG